MSWRVYIVVTWNSARAPCTCSRLAVCDATLSYQLRAKTIEIVVFAKNLFLLLVQTCAPPSPAFVSDSSQDHRSSIDTTTIRSALVQSVGRWILFDFFHFAHFTISLLSTHIARRSEKKINSLLFERLRDHMSNARAHVILTFKLFVFSAGEITKTKICVKRTRRKSCAQELLVNLNWTKFHTCRGCCGFECKISVNYSDSCKIQCCILWCVSESRF